MKQSKSMVVGSLLLGGILAFSLYGIGSSIASGRYVGYQGEDETRYSRRYYAERQQWMNAQHEVYVEECGSCHLAYPAQFLPPESWQKIMMGLEDHFGESAEMDETVHRQVGDFLQFASTPKYRTYRKMQRNLGNEVPMRITELPHFRHEHEEIPSRFVEGNDKVSSLSQCDACHHNAEKGWFDEDDVRIPGVGHWDD